MTRPGGLGRGLAALLPPATQDQPGLREVACEEVTPNPRQPRRDFDEAALRELAHSLRTLGMLQPIVVRPTTSGYELVAGERRWRAAQLAGLAHIPALVRHTGDHALLTEALVENVHRAELSPLEEASAYEQLLSDFGLTHAELAGRLGRSRSTISNALRLLGLAPAVQGWLATGALSTGHARALATLPGERQEVIGARVVAEGLSVRQVEEMVRAVPPPDRPPPARRVRASPHAPLQRRLEAALGTGVRIRGNARRGRLEIEFAGEEDLKRLVEVLGRGLGVDFSPE